MIILAIIGAILFMFTLAVFIASCCITKLLNAINEEEEKNQRRGLEG